MSEPIPEDVMQRAREAAREWLHGYGIMTEPYTLAGGDHPAMTSLPEAIARALMEERRAERERCAKVAENSDYFPSEGDSIAASIRGQP